jgi:hypothetical protein
MPLNVPISFIAKNSEVKTAHLPSKPSGYKPTEEYHPTMRLVKCVKCNTVGVAEFLGGFDLRAGDRLMDGKAIQGTCLRCGGVSDLMPLPTSPENEKAIQIYYKIQRTLDAYRRMGWSANRPLIPIEKLRSMGVEIPAGVEDPS